MRIALIQGGTVHNVIEAASGFTLDGYTARELADNEHVGPGWAFDGSAFLPPAERQPPTDVEELTDRVVALALVVLEAVNELRQWDTGLKAAFQNNTTVANIRTAVLALPNMPGRTRRQLLDSMKAKISDGSVG